MEAEVARGALADNFRCFSAKEAQGKYISPISMAQTTLTRAENELSQLPCQRAVWLFRASHLLTELHFEVAN